MYRLCHLQQLEHSLLKPSIGRPILETISKMSKKKTKASLISLSRPKQNLIQPCFNLLQSLLQLYVNISSISSVFYSFICLYFGLKFVHFHRHQHNNNNNGATKNQQSRGFPLRLQLFKPTAIKAIMGSNQNMETTNSRARVSPLERAENLMMDIIGENMGKNK